LARAPLSPVALSAFSIGRRGFWLTLRARAVALPSRSIARRCNRVALRARPPGGARDRSRAAHARHPDAVGRYPEIFVREAPCLSRRAHTQSVLPALRPPSAQIACSIQVATRICTTSSSCVIESRCLRPASNRSSCSPAAKPASWKSSKSPSTAPATASSPPATSTKPSTASAPISPTPSCSTAS